MKKFILATLIILGNISCSSDSDSPEETVDPEVENMAPGVPALISPEDQLFCTTNNLEFSWQEVSDPENDQVTYILEISTHGDFSDLYAQSEIYSQSNTIVVEKGENYFWRVRAKDQNGNFSNYSRIRNFYTEGNPTSNTLPGVPSLIHPTEDNIDSISVELTWDCIDEDGDQLHYELYFGTTNPPTFSEENIIENSYLIEGLSQNTGYFWQVNAIDEKGGKTIGPIWSFTTN